MLWNKNNKKIIHRKITPDELARIPFFNDISDDDLFVLCDNIRVKKFSKDDYVFLENDMNEAAFFLMQGTIQILKDSDDETQIILAEFTAPQLFGELALVSYGKRSASVLAVEDIEVAELTNSCFEWLCSTRPGLAINILKKIANLISTRLRSSNIAYVQAINAKKEYLY